MDHLFDFRVGAGILHGAVFVAASNTVVCLHGRLALALRADVNALKERYTYLHQPRIPDQIAW